MDQSPFESFFVAIAALNATLLLTMVVGVYTAAQTIGSRYGLTARDLAGSAGVGFVFVGLAGTLMALVEAVAGARPDLGTFLGIRLPFASISARPETGLALTAGFIGCVLLALGVLRRVSILTSPASVGLASARNASESGFVDFQFTTLGLPSPPLPEDVAWDWVRPPMSAALVSTPLAPSDVAREKARRHQLLKLHQAESVRLQRGIEQGRIRNPLAPAVSALHQLVEVRNVAAFSQTWHAVVGRIDGWADRRSTAAAPEWIGRDALDLIEGEWLWLEMEELVRHALSARLSAAAVVCVAAMGAQLRRFLVEGTSDLPTRHLSAAGLLAVEQDDGPLVQAILGEYGKAAEHGLRARDSTLFGHACLGIGHFGELASRFPPRARSIISANRPGEFVNPVDAALECANRLGELAYGYRESELDAYPLFLIDSLVLCFHAALESGHEGRGETALKCLYGLNEVLRSMINVRNHDGLRFVANELKSIATKIASGTLSHEVLDQAWQSLAHDVVVGIHNDLVLGGGGAYSAAMSFVEIVKAMPPNHRANVGEVAWRSYLEFGVPALKRIRAEIEAALGPQEGWYV